MKEQQKITEEVIQPLQDQLAELEEKEGGEKGAKDGEEKKKKKKKKGGDDSDSEPEVIQQPIPPHLPLWACLPPKRRWGER